MVYSPSPPERRSLSKENDQKRYGALEPSERNPKLYPLFFLELRKRDPAAYKRSYTQMGDVHYVWFFKRHFASASTGH